MSCSSISILLLLSCFYIDVVERKAASPFTLAYVEPTPGRAHHPTCPWIEIPEDRRLLRHTPPSCRVWPTATVWSLLMNSNRPFSPLSHHLMRLPRRRPNFPTPLGEFPSCKPPPPRLIKPSSSQTLLWQNPPPRL